MYFLRLITFLLYHTAALHKTYQFWRNKKKNNQKKNPKQTNKLNNEKKRKQSKKKTKQKQIWSKLYVKVTMGINKKKLIGHLRFGTYFFKGH